jgi:hypothetical protein
MYLEIYLEVPTSAIQVSQEVIWQSTALWVPKNSCVCMSSPEIYNQKVLLFLQRISATEHVYFGGLVKRTICAVKLLVNIYLPLLILDSIFFLISLASLHGFKVLNIVIRCFKLIGL